MNTILIKRLLTICTNIFCNVTESISKGSVRIKYSEISKSIEVEINHVCLLLIYESKMRQYPMRFYNHEKSINFNSSESNELIINDIDVSSLNDDELFQISLIEPLANEIEYFRELNSVLNPYIIIASKKLLDEQILNSIEDIICEYKSN